MARRTALILVTALALGPASTGAQSPSLPLPVRVDTLVSAKVGEPREFWVSLPDRYNDSAELIPHVAKTYRTTDYRILYGTSNTGFTAVHALFRNPDLANAYIAASATLSVPSFRTGRDNLEKARECYRRALVIAPGHASATARLTGDETFAGYIGQAPPEQTPRVFSLQTHGGYFASDRIAISADGRELYYTEVTNTWSDYNIRYYKYADGKWNGPLDLFAGFLGPALSVDNKTMWFEKYTDSRTCWQSKRRDAGWSAPTLCTDVPDPKDKHYLRDTASGRIYASSRGALNGIGQLDISTYVKADATSAYHSLGRPLNSPGNEGDFYVARDEAFIVFGSPHRGGSGGGDLFISFRESDGPWSDPKNLGATINTPGFEFGPYVTDDKRYLFYSSSTDFTRVDIRWVRFDSLLETLRLRPPCQHS